VIDRLAHERKADRHDCRAIVQRGGEVPDPRVCDFTP
jgi:hypothetical protein